MEKSEADGQSKLFIAVVHAVFLEFGFVHFDLSTGKKNKKKIDGFCFPEGRDYGTADIVSVNYTIPDLMGSDLVDTVVLEFQDKGKHVAVYVSAPEDLLFPLSFDESHIVPLINSVSANDEEEDGSSSISSHEDKIFPDFTKTVKDRLAFPLLIDLCEKTGVTLPPCFMRLPTELKNRVLKLLQGIDIARIGLVCSELRYLSSDDDLWKRKFPEEFWLSNAKRIQGWNNWKKKFAVFWERKKELMEKERMNARRKFSSDEYLAFRNSWRSPRLY